MNNTITITNVEPQETNLQNTGDVIYTNDYNDVGNKPQINKVELMGNKTLDDLGIQAKGNYATKEYVDDKMGEISVIEGPVGPAGADGKDGKDGYTPIKGIDYFDGKDGKDGEIGPAGVDGYTPIKNIDYFDGKDGVNGKDGKDGYTPVKGVDYYTEDDKTEMIALVLEALPSSEEVSY